GSITTVRASPPSGPITVHCAKFLGSVYSSSLASKGPAAAAKTAATTKPDKKRVYPAMFIFIILGKTVLDKIGKGEARPLTSMNETPRGFANSIIVGPRQGETSISLPKTK